MTQTDLKAGDVVDLFNNKLAGKGKIRPCPSFFLPMTVVQDFLTMKSYPRFDKIETWEEYFDLVLESDWLVNKFSTTLSWLIRPENAFKVYEGSYRGSYTEKPAGGPVNHGALADMLFDRIIRNGRYQYGELKKELTDLELMAIEKNGGIGPIFDCTNATIGAAKTQFRAAYKQALDLLKKE